MHIRIFPVNSFVAISILVATPICGQQDLTVDDLNPSPVQIDRNSNEQNVPAFRRIEQPSRERIQSPTEPPHSQPSIFQNGLRDSSDLATSRQIQGPPQFKATFDQQPQPPESRGSIENGDRHSNLEPANQIDQLNPARLTPKLGGRFPVQSSSVNDMASPPQFDELSNQQSIPVVPPDLERHSILTPRISASLSNEPESTIPAGYEADTETSRSVRDQAVKTLLAAYNVSSAQQPLPGFPMDLKDMLQTTPVPSRMNMVQQYWETYFDWATLQNRKSHAGWLNQIQNPRSQPEQLILQTAKSMAANEILAAEIQLSRSQSKLQQLSRSNREQLLPLPLSEPLTGKYITHYEWYASRQMLPAKLTGINEMLPRTFQLLSQRANTVRQAEQSRNQSRNAHASGQLGITDVLESGRLWLSSLQGFVSTVASYNQAISDYALTITPAEKSIDQIVSMLVAKPKSVADVAQRNSIMQQQPQVPVNAAGPNAGPYRQNAGTTNSTPNQLQPNRIDLRSSGGQSVPATSNVALSANKGFQPTKQLQNRNTNRQPNNQPAAQNDSLNRGQRGPSNRSSQFNGGSGGSFGGAD